MRFEFDLGEGYALGMRTLDTAAEMHRLTAANIDRLRRWEPWAHGLRIEASDEDWLRSQLAQFVDGTALPLLIRHHGAAIGAISARIDRYAGAAELGYWVDGASEGRGVVTRAARALIAHLGDRRVHRVEIRTAASNARSIRLAERLGFQREGTLRQALPVGDRRLDLAVYGLLATDASSRA